jgi:hypothetical protein
VWLCCEQSAQREQQAVVREWESKAAAWASEKEALRRLQEEALAAANAKVRLPVHSSPPLPSALYCLPSVPGC